MFRSARRGPRTISCPIECRLEGDALENYNQQEQAAVVRLLWEMVPPWYRTTTVTADLMSISIQLFYIV